MKKVWVAWFDNGYQYDDHWVEMIGVFTTELKARDAGQVYTRRVKENKTWMDRAFYYVKPVTLDQSI